MKLAMLLSKGKIEAHRFFAAIIIMVSAFAFTSCVELEDTNQSMVLSGEWRGDFGMYYNYVDRYGREYTFDSYDTYLTFVPAYNYATYGRGTQVDYYDYGPYEYQYYEFRWQISNGNLYLTYDYDHELDVCIRNYYMSNDYFKGTFSASGTKFRLRKIVDYYNWTVYDDIYGYGYRYDWYYDYPLYAPLTRGGDELPNDSIASASEGKVLARGRRSSLQQ